MKWTKITQYVVRLQSLVNAAIKLWVTNCGQHLQQPSASQGSLYSVELVSMLWRKFILSDNPVSFGRRQSAHISTLLQSAVSRVSSALSQSTTGNIRISLTTFTRGWQICFPVARIHAEKLQRTSNCYKLGNSSASEHRQQSDRIMTLYYKCQWASGIFQ